MKLMEHFALLLMIVAMPLVFSSCSSDDEPKPEPEPTPKSFFEIEKGSYKVSSEAQTIEVLIHTNIKVSATTEGEDSQWITITNVLQDDDYLTYQVNLKENTDKKERIGNLVFSSASGKESLGANTIVIIQSGVIP